MNMMRKLITVLLLTITTVLNAQDFEGTLTYLADIKIVSQKMLDMGMTEEILKSKMEADGRWADTIKISYKNGFYRQLNLSAVKSWIIYRPDSNKLYTFQEGDASNICIVADASIDLENKMTGKMPTITLLDSLYSDDDYKLRAVEVKWSTGSYYYMFDENHFKVNPENFKGHIYDGFYEFLKLSKSLPIEIYKKTNDIIKVRLTLIESSNEQIDYSLFEVPELIEDESLNSFNTGAGKFMKIKK